MLRELLWLLLVAEMATETQQQQQQQQKSTEFQSAFPSTSRLVPPSPLPSPSPPPSPSPTDDNRSSDGTSEDQLRMMMTLPSEDDGLVLATGETAILECRVSSAAAAEAFVALNKNLSWMNTMTNMTMTTHRTAVQNISLIYQTLSDSNQTSLILMMSNLTVGKNELRCELDIDENSKIQKTVQVIVFSSDRLCTFEGETTCGWENGKAWTRKSSVAAASEPATCDAGFPDHTYGKDNVNGHYLIARVTVDQQTEGGTLSTTLRNSTECIRFYYRTCKTSDSRGGAQLVYMTKAGESSSPQMIINLSLALDWTEYVLVLSPKNQVQHQIIMSVTYSNASDFAYIAIDDIRMEDDNCCDSADQEVTKTDTGNESGSLLQPPTSIVTTNTALTTTGSTNSQSSASKTTSTSTISSSTTTTTTQPTSSSTTTTTTTTSTTASSSSLPPTAVVQSTVTSPRLTSLSAAATARRTPNEIEDSVRPTDEDRRSAAAAAAATDEGGDDADEETAAAAAAAAAAATGDNSTGLAIGIILAIMVAGACTAAILYRRRKNGKKSTYITFGNPSYSREHLPVNDFGLDSPLTLSSNGYTVLA